jgi:organic hydroperoxide reductase OsmC/OhrA
MVVEATPERPTYAASMTREYAARLEWTGNTGHGTSRYDRYGRQYRIDIAGKPSLAGSADPVFRGDPHAHNPEDLFIASIAACHMLTYLALCARQGLRVLAYEDAATGWLDLDTERRFTKIELHPRVTVAAAADRERAESLHHAAHDQCFIASSCRVPIRCLPDILVEEQP